MSGAKNQHLNAGRQVSSKRRKLSAFGPLDRATRAWRYLPSVHKTCGQMPRGEELVFLMNDTTMEIGQGLSGIRGYIWPVALAGLLATIGMLYVTIFELIPMTNRVDSLEELGGVGIVIFGGVFGPLLLTAAIVFCAFLFINDLFGYADGPIRFDRVRRKVYVWSGWKEGVFELDWDRLKVVTQSVAAVPAQVNSFKSVLLVDEDESGEVRFEGRIPRIAQIGAMSLNREAAMAQYEFVRTFMERGPEALPAVSTHLVWRPRGWRVFVDIFGILRTWVHTYPQLAQHQRSPVTLALATLFFGLFSVVLWPMQLGQAIATKWGNRIPRWPRAYQELAAEGGEMLPPKGASPTDAHMNSLEKAIGGFWLLCGLSTWLLILWGILR